MTTNKSELIDDMKNAAVDGVLTMKIYRENGSFSCQTLRNYFGSFSEARDAAGLDEYTNDGNYNDEYDKQNLIEDLRETADGGFLSKRDYAEKGKYSPSLIKRKFGSWNKGKEAAGLKTQKHPNYVNDLEIWDDVKRVNKKVDGRLKKVDYKKLGKYSARLVVERFGLWTNITEKLK